MNNSPILMWFRRDLRLGDHDALSAACKMGRPVIPVFIHDDQVATLGAAPIVLQIRVRSQCMVRP